MVEQVVRRRVRRVGVYRLAEAAPVASGERSGPMIWLVTAVGLLARRLRRHGRGRPHHGEPGRAHPRRGAATPRAPRRRSAWLAGDGRGPHRGVRHHVARRAAARRRAARSAGGLGHHVARGAARAARACRWCCSPPIWCPAGSRSRGPQTVADRVLPILRPWSRVLGLLLPARTVTRPTDLRSIWREGAAVGVGPTTSW